MNIDKKFLKEKSKKYFKQAESSEMFLTHHIVKENVYAFNIQPQNYRATYYF